MAVSIHGNNGLVTTNGTAAAPSLAAPDTDTGLYFGTNLIHATTDGTERLRITSTGVVSINDSTPETWAALQVKNHTGANAAAVLIHGADMAQIVLRDETGGTNTKCTTLRNDQGTLKIGTHNDAYGGFSEKLSIASTGLIYVNGDATGGRIDATAGDGSMIFSDGNGRQTLKIKTMASGQSAAHVFDANGRLGIGHATPDALLTLKGSNPTIRFHDGSTLVGGIEGDTTQTTLYGYNGSDIVISTASGASYADRFRITTDGYVGVKRSAPLANLHTTNNELAIGANPTSAAAPNATYDGLVVDGEAGSFINIRSRGNGSNSYGRVAFSDDVRSRGYIEYRHKDGTGDDWLGFATAGGEKVRIDASGHMGLGITPSDIDSIGRALNIASSTGGAIYLQDTDSPTGKFAAISYNGGTAALQIHAHHGASYIDLGTDGTERVRIDSSGRLRVVSTTESADSAFDDLIVGNHSGNRGISILSANGQQGAIGFAKSGVLADGYVAYVHNSTANQSAMTIKSSGTIQFNTNSTAAVLINKRRSILQQGGVKLSICDGDYDNNHSGSYIGWHADNHANMVIGLNCQLNYSSSDGTHQWKQNNAHGTIGSAGIYIGGNGSNNSTDICFFRNAQGSSAGTTFAQDSWKFRISELITLNYNQHFSMTGYFRTRTSYQTATNCPAHATGMSYAYGYQEAYSTSNGSWVSPYPNLVLGYHTGTSFGSHQSYQGCRFYHDHPSSNSSILMSIGNNNSGVHVTNTFTAGTKTFRIAHPHPSKKYTHDLVHSVIEGPQCDNIYRGKVDLVGGTATINIDTKAGMTDGTFVLLNRDVQCFTSNETGWGAVKGSVSGNILTITAQDNSSTDTISWMVVGERQDDKIKSPDVEVTDSNGKLIMEPLTIEESHM